MKDGKHLKDSPGQVMITLLKNAFLFSLENVIILIDPGKYRLLVIGKMGKWADQYFNSLEEAKKFFLERYNSLAIAENLEAEWTIQYTPYKKWLKDKLDKKWAKDQLAPKSLYK